MGELTTVFYQHVKLDRIPHQDSILNHNTIYHVIQERKALFFLILGLLIFFQNIKDLRRKKNKNKNYLNFFLFNLKHIWTGEKNTNKNCMILHCKIAEMTIILSFLHFYSVKSYNFCYFFLKNI